MKRFQTYLFSCLSILLLTEKAFPESKNIFESHISDSYYYVDFYEVSISATPAEIWPHLFAIYQSTMSHHSGPVNQEGEIFKMYEEQNFFFEITKIIPNQLVMGVNLPSEMQGEESMGVSMFTLTKRGERTILSNFMSRRYDWFQPTPNHLMKTRQTREFRKSRNINMNALMQRIKEAAEHQPNK